MYLKKISRERRTKGNIKKLIKLKKKKKKTKDKAIRIWRNISYMQNQSIDCLRHYNTFIRQSVIKNVKQIYK